MMVWRYKLYHVCPSHIEQYIHVLSSLPTMRFKTAASLLMNVHIPPRSIQASVGEVIVYALHCSLCLGFDLLEEVYLPRITQALTVLKINNFSDQGFSFDAFKELQWKNS